MIMSSVQKITANLWFNGNAQEAVEYYVSIFPDSAIDGTTYYPTEGLLDFQQAMAGKPLTIAFTLAGVRFIAINAGPEFTFNEAVSFSVDCRTQEEIDYFWDKLSKHPENEQCGWCKDQFGVSWQVVPGNIDDMMSGPNGAPRPSAYAAMMNMKKIDIDTLRNA